VLLDAIQDARRPLPQILHIRCCIQLAQQCSHCRSLLEQRAVPDWPVAGDHTTVAGEEAVCEAIDAFGECPRGGRRCLDFY
jgi:hypothetical protein